MHSHESQADRIEKKVDQLISGLELKKQQDRIESKIDKLLADQFGGMTAEEVDAATEQAKKIAANLRDLAKDPPIPLV